MITLKMVALKDLGNISTGKTPPTKNKEYFNPGEILFFKPDSFKKNVITPLVKAKTKISVDGLKKSTKAKKGDVLITCIGEIGNIGIATCDCAFNQQINAISPATNICYNLYLAYALLNSKHILVHDSNAAVVPILNKSSFSEIKIPIPYPEDPAKSLTEQKRIAAILDKAEAIRKKRKESLRLADEFLKSTFLEMFGDPVTNPKSLQKVACIDVAKCIVPGRDKPKSFTGTMPWVTTEDLNDKWMVAKSNKGMGLTSGEINEVNARIIPEGSVIFTCVGDLGVVSINTKSIVMNQQLHSFQCNPEKVNDLFMAYNISFQKSYMYKYATTSTVPYMNKTTCNNIPITLPSLKLQCKFAEIVHKVKSMISKINEKDNGNFFNSLVQRAFKGEL